MKKAFFALAAACAALGVFGIAASQQWVRSYCADHGLAATNTAGGAVYSGGEGTNAFSFAFATPTAYALVATNCSAAALADGVTNGMRFAWHQPYAVYLNEPAQRRIWIDVNTNDLSRTYLYNSWTGVVQRVEDRREMWFTDAATNRHFRVFATHIFADEAHSLTNGFNGGGL